MIEKLIEISRQLGFKDLENRLLIINATLNNGQAELIVPLVGEFSAGKTTLVNALTDSKALECASKPTTATIYTIHFASNECKAIVHNPDGTTIEVSDISELKNDGLKDAVVVDVYDTSLNVPDSVVIVDTPGLSSQDIKHRQTLVDFLPNADAIILVSDINQQITRSLSEFAKTIALSKRPIYLAFTQCDTKSEKDVLLAKEYLLKNTELPLSGVVCVSAKTGKMDELYSLLRDIQRDKTSILTRVNAERCKGIAQEMVSRIDTLLNSSESDSAIEEAIREQQLKVNKIKQQILALVDSICADLNSIQREVSRNFEDKIFDRLDSIVGGKSDNYDSEAISAINNTSSLLLNEYKNRVLDLLGSKVNEQARKDDLVSIDGIQTLDLSQLSISGLSYNINLNEAGHGFDKSIATGLKVAAVATAVVVTAGAAAGAAGGAAVAGEAGSAALSGGQAILVAADVADTVTDVGSIIANKRHADKINKAIQYGNQINDKLGKMNDFDSSAGQRMGQSKGMVESLVGFVTESTMGKPQRRRAIHKYIDSSLAPSFAEELRRITSQVSSNITGLLNEMAETQCAELTSSLEALKQSRQEQKSAFDERIKELKQYKHQINSL